MVKSNKGKYMYVPPDVLSMLDTISQTKNKRGAEGFKEMASLSRIGLEIDIVANKLDLSWIFRRNRK